MDLSGLFLTLFNRLISWLKSLRDNKNKLVSLKEEIKNNQSKIQQIKCHWDSSSPISKKLSFKNQYRVYEGIPSHLIIEIEERNKINSYYEELNNLFELCCSYDNDLDEWYKILIQEGVQTISPNNWDARKNSSFRKVNNPHKILIRKTQEIEAKVKDITSLFSEINFDKF